MLRTKPPPPSIKRGEGCVVSFCPIASAVGNSILADGGNAVDAAVATGLALSVTYPQAASLGGGGFMLVRTGNGQHHFIDFRETAPRRVRLEQFLDSEGNASAASVIGALGVGVPGNVAGFSEALERLGTLPWDRLVGRAVELAERGFWLTTRQAFYLNLYADELSQFESTRDYFLPNRPIRPGTPCVQPHLGATLRTLADLGPEAFYSGPIAEQTVAEIARNGGVLDEEDLRAYRVRWREPLIKELRGSRLVTAPLPSSGGLVVAIALEHLFAAGVDGFPAGSAERLDLVARAMSFAFQCRQELAGDPDFMTAEERNELLTFLARPADPRRLETLGEPDQPIPQARGNDTTHFCVTDGDGGAVSCTISLNTLFGSRLAVGGAGFLLNNTLDDFVITDHSPNWYGLVGGRHNRLAPLRRPVGSMAPTLVEEADRVRIVIGAAGGPRIPSLVVQVVTAVLCDRLTVTPAMRAPRVHHQHWPAVLQVEPHLPDTVTRELLEMGHRVEMYRRIGIGTAIGTGLSDNELDATLDDRFFSRP